MSDIFLEYRTHLTILKDELPLIIRYFQAASLLQAYGQMMRLVIDKTSSTIEGSRVANYAAIFEEHFTSYYTDHINLRTHTIFDEAFVGGQDTLDAWQEAGYSMERTEDNYDKRLLIWQGIWNNGPVVLPIIRTTKSGRVYQQVLTFYVRNRSGRRVTYEDIIDSRNENFPSLVRYIPFWLPFNYGTASAEVGGRAGYPRTQGIYFTEVAKHLVDLYDDLTLRMLDRFLVTTLDGEVRDFSSLALVAAARDITDIPDIDTRRALIEIAGT